MLVTLTLPAITLAAWGPTHWIIVAIAVLVLFGGRKLPELARGMARGLRIFKDEMHGVKSEINEVDADAPPAKPLESKPEKQPEEQKRV